jgi:transcriptional regulator with XRE-family HTH domain
MQAMAKARESAPRSRDPRSEIVIRNLRSFRAAVGMSQDDAATASGVPIDNLRRYESGTVTPPAHALLSLGEIYGHTVEHFFQSEPPQAKLEDRPMVFFRALPGVVPDAELMAKVEKVISQVNTEFRERKRSPAKRR